MASTTHITSLYCCDCVCVLCLCVSLQERRPAQPLLLLCCLLPVHFRKDEKEEIFVSTRKICAGLSLCYFFRRWHVPIGSLGASWQRLMIPALQRNHQSSSRRRKGRLLRAERSERTMPATTNNTAAGARTRSRGNASGCRQTASHVEINTRRPLPWRLLRGQAKAGRVRCCRPPLGLCARKKRRG